MNNTIISKLMGIDIHTLAMDGKTRTVSYSDFKNTNNAEISMNISEQISHFSDLRYEFDFNLHTECDGYTVKCSEGTLMKIGENNIPTFKIKDVSIIVPDKVVEVAFEDGTKEKSVCREPDAFSLESAISICISKKIMGGSGAYNNAVKRGMKVYQDKLNKEAAEKTEQERIEKKRAKRLAYKECRAIKRAEEESRRKHRKKKNRLKFRKKHI